MGLDTFLWEDNINQNIININAKVNCEVAKKMQKLGSKINLNRKIKIAHIITRMITGGAEENTLYTVEGLDKKKD